MRAKFSSFRRLEKISHSFSSLSIPIRRHIVRDDDVAILFAQFFRGVCFEVDRFRGEADEEEIVDPVSWPNDGECRAWGLIRAKLRLCVF